LERGKQGDSRLQCGNFFGRDTPVCCAGFYLCSEICVPCYKFRIVLRNKISSYSFKFLKLE
jgi:hypothetical protein